MDDDSDGIVKVEHVNKVTTVVHKLYITKLYKLPIKVI